MPTFNRAYILLGSNINKERNIPAAIKLLKQKCNLLAVSSIYKTAPVGTLNQPDFWNVAALLETELDAYRLKREVLAESERRLGRRRAADKNGPRTIDADIILFNQETFQDNGLRIPDPDLLKYPHVAIPVAELAPWLPHPETGEPLAAIAQRLAAQASPFQVMAHSPAALSGSMAAA